MNPSDGDSKLEIIRKFIEVIWNHKYKCIALFFVILPMVNSLALLIYAIVINTTLRFFFDETSVFFSKNKGREVTLAPFAVLAEMSNYGGWKDKYYYPFADIPTIFVKSYVKLDKYTTFKVVDEKTMSGSIFTGPDKNICILENIKQPDQKKTAVECKKLIRLAEVTQIYKDIDEEIKKYGRAYVATAFYYHNDLNFKMMFKINRFVVLEFRSLEEALKFLTHEDQPSEYHYILNSKLPFVIKDSDVFNEDTSSLLIITSYGSGWYHDDQISFKDYLLRNKVPDDMNNWVLKNYPNSAKERWELRVLVSLLQQMLLSEKDDRAFRAMDNINGYEEIKTCLSQYFIDSKSATASFAKLKLKYLENPTRAKKYKELVELKNGFEGNTGSILRGCDEVLSPLIRLETTSKKVE